MITVASLKKNYGGRSVLDIPSLSFEAGERCALIGANGSGKSTLLRILASQLRADAGSVDLGGIPESDVGYLPQQPYAFDMSVLQNVALSLGRSRNAEKLALAALNGVGLQDFAFARAKELSGGETQRMALARILVREWKLLLLDEPTSSADTSASEKICGALKDYAESTGATLVFSSHTPSFAKSLGTRAVVLDSGRVVESGKADVVLRAPKSAEARAFLASWSI